MGMLEVPHSLCLQKYDDIYFLTMFLFFVESSRVLYSSGKEEVCQRNSTHLPCLEDDYFVFYCTVLIIKSSPMGII